MTRKLPLPLTIAGVVVALACFVALTATLIGGGPSVKAIIESSRIQRERSNAALDAAMLKADDIAIAFVHYSDHAIRSWQAREIARIVIDAGGDGIDADRIMNMVFVESRFNPYAVGRSGERGMLQILPSTAGMSAKALSDPVVGFKAGLDHYRWLVKKTGDKSLATVAYNTGLYSRGVRYAMKVKEGKR